MNPISTATLGGGCFWCTEAIFKRLKGVEDVISGYSGGHEISPTGGPTYEQVASGATGYAEAIQVKFDPAIISFMKLIEIFFYLHDPTTLNKQGADEGTQYRSVIFYHNKEQKDEAETIRDKVADSGAYKNPIITEIVPFEQFYPAEKYHQNFYEDNKNQGYCSYVISPKIHKLLKEFSREVKDEYKNDN